MIDLGYPVLGIVSDGQKSIRLAVMDLFPDVPYQLCHYHYLDDISTGLEDRDRALKTKLKKGIRDIRTVERRVEKMEDGAEKDVLNDFTIAVRTTALQKSVYPFDCSGISIHDQLMDIEATLGSRQKVKAHPHNFPADSEEKRKRRLMGYMGYVAKLKQQYPELAAALNHIIKVTKSFLPHLFAYLRCPQLPVTNNDLEVFHRNVKAKHRRRTGRKSSHDYIIRYGMFAVYQMGMDCRDRLKVLAYPKLKALKEQLKSVRRRYSKMYRVRHKRPEFLTQLLERWTTAAIPAPT